MPLEYTLLLDIKEYNELSAEDYLNGDPNARDRNGLTLLHKYVWNPHFDARVMQSIINRGVPLEYKDSLGKTAFLLAVLNRKKKAMELLINNGADIHVKDSLNNNALHYIALPGLNSYFERLENFNFDDTYYILERLLKGGVDVNAGSLTNEETPLMYAVQGKHLEIVKMLLAFGANVHLTNARGETCLHFAVYYDSSNPLCASKWKDNNHAILSELVRNKACVNCFDIDLIGPLNYTLRGDIINNDAFAKELIKNSALLHWYKRTEFYLRFDQIGNRLEPDLRGNRNADLYYEEIDRMKRHILPPKSDEERNEMERRILPSGSNLCEFAREGVNEDDLRITPVIKDEVLKIILTESFPLYLDLILSKLGRRFLLEKASRLSIFTIIEDEEEEEESLNSDTRRVKKVVELNSDMVYEICCILEDIDILNLLSASPDQFSEHAED